MDANATYRMLLQGREQALLRRPTGSGQYIDVLCAARTVKYTPEQLAAIVQEGGVVQGMRMLVISNHEIAETGWPGPPQTGDIAVLLNQGPLTANVIGVSPVLMEGMAIRFDIDLRTIPT